MEIKYAIERKSTGMLVDEMLTTDLKIESGQDAGERRHQLGNAVVSRTAHIALDQKKNKLFFLYVECLRKILKECWDAQEIVSLSDLDSADHNVLVSCAIAGKLAQSTNRERNIWIRQIDELVEDSGVSPLEKTYGG
jgi:hypothetical protein